MFIEIIFSVFFICFIFVLFDKLRPKRVVSPFGKAVLITGCDSGFGNKLAQKLNHIGFRVYATVLNSDSPGAQELKTNAVFADQMIVLQMNVTNDSEVNEVYEKVKRDLQSRDHILWAVVNNAGINSTCPLEWATMETYYRIFAVNLWGAVRVTRTFMPLIRVSQGRIISIASILGRFSGKFNGIYSMTKHALIGFSDTLRREVSRFNIKVSTIEPAGFSTAFADNMIEELEQNWSQSSDEVKKSYVNYEYERRLFTNVFNLVPMSEKFNVVVEDITDSIINCRPKHIYRPIVGVLNKISMFMFIYFPTNIVDSLVMFGEKLIIH